MSAQQEDVGPRLAHGYLFGRALKPDAFEALELVPNRSPSAHVKRRP